jgi:hypothetical protein
METKKNRDTFYFSKFSFLKKVTFLLLVCFSINSYGQSKSVKGKVIDNSGDGLPGVTITVKGDLKKGVETDFDNNGTNDIVLGYYNQGCLFPLRGRECSSSQMPFIKEKFPTYNSFGTASLSQVYGYKKLEDALHLKVTTFASVYMENLGNGQFNLVALPKQAQLSSINDISIFDFNNDGTHDILIAGNMYQSEEETPRNDASYGLLLKNNGTANFTPVSASESGVLISGEVRKIKSISIGKDRRKAVLIAKNNDFLELLIVNKR